MFIVGEEIGWRGYLLPRMQQLTSKRRAAVLTGFVHGCFHLPLILLATTYNTEGSRWVAAPVAVAVITAGGVFYAWIWDRAKTVWPVAIAHNAVNTVFDARFGRGGRHGRYDRGVRRRRDRVRHAGCLRDRRRGAAAQGQGVAESRRLRRTPVVAQQPVAAVPAA